MLSRQERSFYSWVTGHWAMSTGAVVDLGCFAGGSTARLAQGMQAAGNTQVLHAYDRFTADENAKKRWLYPAGVERFVGNDMFEIVQGFLAAWSDRIQLHRGDITQLGWSGDPIEVLVVDAAKSAHAADRIASDFYGSLIPGRSLLIHQDCLHWRQPWLLHQMDRLAEVLKPVCQVRNDTIAYICTGEITVGHISSAQTSDVSDADLLATIGQALSRSQRPWVQNRLERMAHGVRVNPGVRIAWKMMPPA